MSEPHGAIDSQPVAATRSGMGAVNHDAGTDFRVWAPHAEAVHVTGSFNDWAEPGVPLVRDDNGHWSGAVTEARAGDLYKYRLAHGGRSFLKADPRARAIDEDSGNAVIYRDAFDWDGVEFETPSLHEMVIYELHVGTFGGAGGAGSSQDLIERLPHLVELGVNAIELLPPAESPAETSWGYNTNHPFAVESGYGGPEGLKTLIREAHRAGIAVLLDMVYNHFGPDELDLWQFDGWSENEGGGIYFYNDWRAKTPWGRTRPDFGREEVRQYLRDNAMMWIEEFRADGLRIDAVAFIRGSEGPHNPQSVDSPEGWQLLQWINKDLKLHSDKVISIAEDLGNVRALTAWVDEGGAGFDAQWDASFIHPLRAVLQAADDDDRDLGAIASVIQPGDRVDPFRRVIYFESHDEVANGRSRTTTEMDPQDPAGVFVRRRVLQGAGVLLTSPGVPMIFQGQEFLEDGWFDDRDGLDWDKAKQFAGIRRAFRDLIRLRRNIDGNTRGLTGRNVDVFHHDLGNKVLAWNRWFDGGPRDSTVVIINLSNRGHEFYELPLPAEGEWRVRFNADWKGYADDFFDTELTLVEGRADDDHPLIVGGLALPPYALVILSRD